MGDVNEARLRAENSGLWFSTEAANSGTKDARNADSALFKLADVQTNAARTLSHNSAGSGLIDIRTLAAAANDPGDVPARSRPVTLLPGLVPPLRENPVAVVAPPRGSTAKLLKFSVGLLVALVALLGYIALT